MMRRTAIVGGAAWLLTAIMFAAEALTMSAWPRGYSLVDNTISDLGSTSCGTLLGVGRDGVHVCSPWHALMNGVFVAVGGLTVLGAVLLRGRWPSGGWTTAGLIAIVASGAGAVVIGLAPADQNLPLHAVGALLQVPGAVGPVFLARSTRPGLERRFSMALGLVGGVASGLFLAQVHLGLGPGGMERLAFEPLTAWMAVLGAAVLARHLGIAETAVSRADG